MIKEIALACALLSLASLSAAAQDAAAPAGEHGKRFQACAADIQKFCANVEKGKGLMRQCLDTHNAELSDGCKARLAEHAAKSKDNAPQ